MPSSLDNIKSTSPVQDFRQELARGNVPRMWWLLVTSTSLSLAMVFANVLMFRRWEFVPWQMLDLIGSAIFLGLFWLAGRGRLSEPWVWSLSPAYFAFWLILMDGYYFNGVPLTGDVVTYVLGALAPAILIILPPRIFLSLLIPNHVIFCWLVFLQTSRGSLSGVAVFTTLVNGTLGVLIAGLGAWFLFRATRMTYEKTKQVEAKTQETKLAASRMRAILENIPFQAWLKDTEGTFLAVNREFTERAGRPEKEILGRSCREVYSEERAERYMKEDAEIVLTQGRQYFEESIEGKGGLRWFEVFKSPVLADDGTCVGTSGLARDITERKEIEARLRAADTAKSEFLATMSHEIRTPMNSVLGYAELLRNTDMTETQAEYVASINHSGQLLLAVINDILDFSKIEAGKIVLKAEVFSLDDLVDRMAAMFKPLADRKGLSFQVSCDENMPRLMRGDVHRVEQLLVNLLSNAVKFTTLGGVTIRVRRERAPHGEFDWISFQVTDTGIGIPSSEVERLFKPFSQIDSAMARRFSGTGLGLVIVKRLCQLMDGNISVESRYGRGSTFTASIRLTEETVSLPPMEEAPNPGTDEGVDFSSCRVLVVEDNLPNRRLVTTLLARWKIKAVAVDGGEEAIRAVQRQPFDLILMDIQMPGMDGLEATRLIREWESEQMRPSRAQIVALTAFALADDSARCLEAGMDTYLSKPLKIAALRDVVLKACLAGNTAKD